MLSVDERVPGGMRHRFPASTRVKIARWLLNEGIYPVIQNDPCSTVMVSGRGWTVSSFGLNRFVERMLPEVLDSKRERFVQQLVRTFATHGERSDQVPRVDVLWETVTLQEAAADWPRAWRGGRRAAVATGPARVPVEGPVPGSGQNAGNIVGSAMTMTVPTTDHPLVHAEPYSSRTRATRLPSRR